MTDRNAAPGTAPPVITVNIRAELARRGLTAEHARGHLGRRSATTGAWRPMSATTWEERMRNPGTWRLQELETLAEALGISVGRLVVGE